MNILTKEHLPIAMRVEKDDHIIGYIRGTGSRLVISISGVGNKRRFFPPWEFVGTASDSGRNHVLLVSERARTWMNSPSLAETIAKQIESLVASEEIDEVVAMGNSMGGFMALVLPQYTNIDRIVAISPQFSMHPNIVPEESRWSFWRARIRNFRHDTVGEIDSDLRDYFILHGSTKNENLHWGRFPYRQDFHHYIIQGEGHSLVVAMKKSGIMSEVLKLAVDGRADESIRVLSTKFHPVRRDKLTKSERFLW